MGSKVGPDELLAAAGLDSIGAVELQRTIAERFGASMPATLAFDFPTVRALAPFVAQRAALVDQAAAPIVPDLGHHSHFESAEKATEVLHVTLDVVADVLGSAIQPNTPLMEVIQPDFPGFLRACMHAKSREPVRTCQAWPSCRPAWTHWVLCNFVLHCQLASACLCRPQSYLTTPQLQRLRPWFLPCQ